MSIIDEHLVLEHKLRERITEVKTRLEDMIIDGEGRSHAIVYISYKANDGGQWEVTSYSTKNSLTAKAAELSIAEQNFASMYRMDKQGHTLRSLIAGPTSNG